MNEKESNAEQCPPERQDAWALRLILAEQPELFCDIVGHPRIRLPPIRDHPVEEPWSIRSPRVRAWIADLFFQHSKLLLHDREIDRILNVLEGMAWHEQPRDFELSVAVDQDSLLEAILLFMEQKIRFEGTMTNFKTELTRLAKNAGLYIKHWPKGPPQLSKRIRQLEPLLEKAEITVERTRGSLARRFTIKREVHDEPASPPSQGPSIDKSHHPTTQRRDDATDDEKRAEMFARINVPFEKIDLRKE